MRTLRRLLTRSRNGLWRMVHLFLILSGQDTSFGCGALGTIASLLALTGGSSCV